MHLIYGAIIKTKWSFRIFVQGKLNARLVSISVTRKKSPIVYESCPKTISLEKLYILTPVQKMPKNVGDLGNWIVVKGFKKLPKDQ